MNLGCGPVARVVAVVMLTFAGPGCVAADPDVTADSPRSAGSSAPTPTLAPADVPTTFPPAAVSDVLALQPAPESTRDGYHRDRFRHWVDADADGCNTRCEVLEVERVASLPGLAGGGWVSAWEGYTTPDASELDIDHVVGLAEAWESGASSWDDGRREAFANDLDQPDALIAVSAATNRSKGDRDPAEWQPPARGAWCQFGRGWIATKVKWGLTADPAEIAALANMIGGC
jgi:hypothetical protein